jgi:hypothetical protein
VFLIFPRRSPLLFFGNKAVVKLWPHRALVTTALAIVLVAVPASALDPDRRISQYAHSAWRMHHSPYTKGNFDREFREAVDYRLAVGAAAGLKCYGES